MLNFISLTSSELEHSRKNLSLSNRIAIKLPTRIVTILYYFEEDNFDFGIEKYTVFSHTISENICTNFLDYRIPFGSGVWKLLKMVQTFYRCFIETFFKYQNFTACFENINIYVWKPVRSYHSNII